MSCKPAGSHLESVMVKGLTFLLPRLSREKMRTPLNPNLKLDTKARAPAPELSFLVALSDKAQTLQGWPSWHAACSLADGWWRGRAWPYFADTKIKASELVMDGENSLCLAGLPFDLLIVPFPKGTSFLSRMWEMKICKLSGRPSRITVPVWCAVPIPSEKSQSMTGRMNVFQLGLWPWGWLQIMVCYLMALDKEDKKWLNRPCFNNMSVGHWEQGQCRAEV